jgi:hypothetical protein
MKIGLLTCNFVIKLVMENIIKAVILDFGGMLADEGFKTGPGTI